MEHTIVELFIAIAGGVAAPIILAQIPSIRGWFAEHSWAIAVGIAIPTSIGTTAVMLALQPSNLGGLPAHAVVAFDSVHCPSAPWEAERDLGDGLIVGARVSSAGDVYAKSGTPDEPTTYLTNIARDRTQGGIPVRSETGKIPIVAKPYIYCRFEVR